MRHRATKPSNMQQSKRLQNIQQSTKMNDSMLLFDQGPAAPITRRARRAHTAHQEKAKYQMALAQNKHKIYSPMDDLQSPRQNRVASPGPLPLYPHLCHFLCRGATRLPAHSTQIFTAATPKNATNTGYKCLQHTIGPPVYPLFFGGMLFNKYKPLIY